MSRLVATIDLSTAAVGTTGSFETQTPNNCSALYVMNESAAFLQLDLGINGQPIVQPWRNRLFTLKQSIQNAQWTVIALLTSTSAPSAAVYVEAFAPNEVPTVSLDGPVFRQSNVGNNVGVSNTNTLINDGSAPATTIIEATPSDQASSSISLDNDASGFLKVLSANVLRNILSVARGNATTGKASITLGDSGDASILTLYGAVSGFQAGNFGALAANAGLTVVGATSLDNGKVTTNGGGAVTLAGVTTTAEIVAQLTAASASNTDTLILARLGSFGTGTFAIGLDSTGHLYCYDSGRANFAFQSVGSDHPLLKSQSAGGGANGATIWEGTTDPGASAAEGDIWIDG